MRSNSSQGLTTITVTFQPGTDIDTAQVLVQNRVALAEPRLPDQVRQIGVTVNKQSSDFLMVAAMTSTDPAVDIDYVGNYANSTHSRPASAPSRRRRRAGVRRRQLFDAHLDRSGRGRRPQPDLRRDRRRASRAECPGRRRLGRPGSAAARAAPAFELPVQVQGRLTDPHEFADVVLKTDRARRARSPGCATSRGSRSAARITAFAGRPAREQAVFMAIQQLPGSNALDTADGVLADLEAASRALPAGDGIFDPLQPDRICPGVGRTRCSAR